MQAGGAVRGDGQRKRKLTLRQMNKQATRRRTGGGYRVRSCVESFSFE